jgi:hypothetical protein
MLMQISVTSCYPASFCYTNAASSSLKVFDSRKLQARTAHACSDELIIHIPPIPGRDPFAERYITYIVRAIDNTKDGAIFQPLFVNEGDSISCESSPRA